MNIRRIKKRKISIKKILLFNILLFNIYIIINDIYKLIIGYQYTYIGIISIIIIFNITNNIINYFYKELCK